MSVPRRRLVHHLHPKRLGNTLGAIAGLASALSVILGYLAARASPRGFARLTVILHLAREPFIVKLAAAVAAVAVATATVAGVLKFYTWWTGQDGAEPPDG